MLKYIVIGAFVCSEMMAGTPRCGPLVVGEGGGGGRKRPDAAALWNDANTFTDPRTYREGDPFLFLVLGLLADHHPLLHDPNLQISDFPFVSSSIISEENNGTYGPWGFILGNFGAENIVATSPYDIAFHNDAIPQITEDNREHFLRMIATSRLSYPLSPPRDIVAKTGDYYYIDSDDGSKVVHDVNETVLLGTSLEGRKIEITGIYVKVRDDSTFIASEAQLRRADQMQKRFGLPLIKIKDRPRENPKRKAKIKSDGWYQDSLGDDVGDFK